jgi:succinate dehydrogenase / fumarate reductase iron-sulfur subunit
MRLKLHVWRQNSSTEPGGFEEYAADEVSEHMSFLEMLDVVNEDLIMAGKVPIEFDHDCREGICGACSLMINGAPHGPSSLTTACQLHMRHFSDGDEVWIEPWRATAFPVLRDLVVDRSALDRIIESGGYISVRTGSAPDANASPIDKELSDEAMDAAVCIGCGACVAACPNASAMLFTAAKVLHLGLLPQGKLEADSRVLALVATHDAEGFGNCTNHGACQEACPKGISVDSIAALNRSLMVAALRSRPAEV